MDSKQLVIMDYASSKVMFIKGIVGETIEDVEAYITEELGFRLKDISYMFADKIDVEW